MCGRCGVAWRNKRRQKKLVASISPSNPTRDEKYPKTCVLGMVIIERCKISERT